ncbi:MAG: APC family permease [Terriglobia bacterium]
MNQPTAQTGAITSSRPTLRRVLTLKDLIVYGLVLMQVIAPVGIFGFAQSMSHGHAVTTILIGMVAMMLTAFSYGRLAAIYQSAGSAYTYVGRELNVYAGFLVGWALTLDYFMIPLINTVFGSLTLHRLMPEIPYVAWVALFVGIITFLNLRGIRAVANTNTLLLGIMTGVVLMFVVLAIRYIAHRQGWTGLFSFSAFYDPRTFDIRSVSRATSLAVLTYVGFDSVTTLSEEVQDARRTVPLATVLICLLVGIYSVVEVYLAQLAWPDYLRFPNLAMAFLDVSQRVGGPMLLEAMGGIAIVACLGSGLTGQVGAARLLYGMGRDNVLPRRLFAHLDAQRGNPTFNIWIIAALTFASALFISYERVAELMNFGAFLGYMGVNLAAIRRFHPRRGSGLLVGFPAGVLAPGLGFVFCFAIWWGLATPAKIIGGLWFLLGFVYLAVKTRGFRMRPGTTDFLES